MEARTHSIAKENNVHQYHHSTPPTPFFLLFVEPTAMGNIFAYSRTCVVNSVITESSPYCYTASIFLLVLSRFSAIFHSRIRHNRGNYSTISL